MNDNNKTSKLAIVALTISAISLACSIFGLAMRPQQSIELSSTSASDAAATAHKTDQYVLYIGTNDKDTYQLEMTIEEAQKRVDDILLKYFDGYTLQEAHGFWLDNEGSSTSEYTLVCILDDPKVEDVYAAADEIRDALRQNTILIEHNTIDMEYYAGK